VVFTADELADGGGAGSFGATALIFEDCDELDDDESESVPLSSSFSNAFDWSPINLSIFPFRLPRPSTILFNSLVSCSSAAVAASCTLASLFDCSTTSFTDDHTVSVFLTKAKKAVDRSVSFFTNVAISLATPFAKVKVFSSLCAAVRPLLRCLLSLLAVDDDGPEDFLSAGAEEVLPLSVELDRLAASPCSLGGDFGGLGDFLDESASTAGSAPRR